MLAGSRLSLRARGLLLGLDASPSQAKTSPPPPYRATSQRDDQLTCFSFPAQPEQWNQRSIEELSDLLHKADELIKDREHELDVTTAVCKSLYEDNLELKNRHIALVARLPPSPAGSTSPSPTSPGSDSDLIQSPHRIADVSQTSPNAHLCAPPIRRHHRLASVSPADLALLSDQNAELLAKLERLETESIQADQSGRKKLRSLENEIQGLRDELDKTRARSDELEKQARVVSGTTVQRGEEEAERKKREREEKFRALRGRTGSEAEEPEIRDFAPGGALSARANSLGLEHPSKVRLPLRRRHISEAVLRPLRFGDDTFPERPRRVSLQSGLSRSAPQPSHTLFPAVQSPIAVNTEDALVSQLLLKIRELEVTNAQITEQQLRTASQLQAVQKDATSLRLVYESLGDGEGVEWLAEDDGESSQTEDEEEDETIRFPDLCRSLTAQPSIDFTGGNDLDMQSSLRQTIIPDHVPVIAHPKVRRSVVGLFDSPRGSTYSPSSPTSEGTPSVLELMIPGLPPVPFVPQPSNTSTTTFVSRSPSPILSPGLGGTVPYPLEDAPCYSTLDSELGAAFDGKWDGQEGQHGSPENHHFRTPSLAGLTSIVLGAEDISDTVSLSSPHTQPIIYSAQYETERSTDAFSSVFSSPQENIRLHPGAWRGLSSPPDVEFETLAEKKRRTIRLRTTHWNEGRFGGTLLPSEKRSSVDISRPPTPIPERLVNAFEAIVDTMSRNRSETDSSSDSRDDQRDSAESSTVVIRSTSDTVTKEHPRQRGVVAFVLEIWLWLQFVIIVVVFVWAMAKRGPKNVLEAAGRKRTGGSRGPG
ncbi:hypothetical protein BU15DRAFT_55641 [Melanogaster broomeanus]|nr:hypothetical protein BU15DRAFT_55641 [Melanogaster broomeanus]